MHDAVTWDLYCRVVDNHGDLGVSWRLAVGLAARGLRVRLWCDELDRLAWMAPDGVKGGTGVTTGPWRAAEALPPCDVVVETIASDIPPAVLAAMARQPRPPTWIDLEYLTAEPYAERCHGLPSPQSAGPGAGMTRWFFYPGFSAKSGGLLRGIDLAARQERFDPVAWLHGRGLERRPGERVVSLFCYPDAPVPALIDELAAAPTLLLATAGEAACAVESTLGRSLQRGELRATVLPLLTQDDYDHLLWSCDLNVVRGEDSFVRAQLAGRPFLWQIYPQQHALHLAKLDAFITQFAGGAEPAVGAASGSAAWRRAMLAWNGAAETGRFPALPMTPADAERAARWRTFLLAQPDLVERLVAFAARRSEPPLI